MESGATPQSTSWVPTQSSTPVAMDQSVDRIWRENHLAHVQDTAVCVSNMLPSHAASSSEWTMVIVADPMSIPSVRTTSRSLSIDGEPIYGNKGSGDFRGHIKRDVRRRFPGGISDSSPEASSVASNSALICGSSCQ